MDPPPADAVNDGTPVLEVRQSWRSFDEGNSRPGEIYIGTYGRGIFSSSAYLDLNENIKRKILKNLS